jgi:hypothetical protein
MAFETHIKDKQAFVFELDDVLYPQKDFLLQVYYLFAQFIEYGEQINAAEMVTYMQQVYAEEGAEVIFEKTARQFNIPERYKVNFDLLLLSARLPLKLLLYNEILNFLQEIVVERRQIFLYVSGNPGMQLNKIKQMEWQGLEQYLTVYFADEIADDAEGGGLPFIINKHALTAQQVLIIGKSEGLQQNAINVGADFLAIDKLLLS